MSRRRAAHRPAAPLVPAPIASHRPAVPVGVPLLLLLPAPRAASHARLQGGRGFHAGPYAAWREAAALAVLAAWTWAPVPAWTPVRLAVRCYSRRQAKRPEWCPVADWTSGERLRRPVRADLENYVEAVGDALMAGAVPAPGGGRLATPGVLADDACIVRIEADDWLCGLGEAPRVEVVLTVLAGLRG